MRICAIVDRVTPVFAGAVEVLTERGLGVDLLRPEAQPIDLAAVRVEHDLYLLKSGTDLALSLAGCLHAAGAATLNPYPTVATLRNKIVVTHALLRAGVPTPASYTAVDPRELVPLLHVGPLILKPFAGSRGEGIHVVRDSGELQDSPPNGPLLVQRYHEPDGRDYKLFCIGGEFFGVRRIWPLRSYADKFGEPFALTPELEDLGRRCSRAFGIDLFGMDVVYSRGRPYVVDVNKFGSYAGVPDAPRRLADYIHAAGRRAVHGEPIAPFLSQPPDDFSPYRGN
jgi:ribosomal protein S6--L-glutamate ligase